MATSPEKQCMIPPVSPQRASSARIGQRLVVRLAAVDQRRLAEPARRARAARGTSAPARRAARGCGRSRARSRRSPPPSALAGQPLDLARAPPSSAVAGVVRMDPDRRPDVRLRPGQGHAPRTSSRRRCRSSRRPATPAARARPSTAARSSANAGSCRCACVSNRAGGVTAPPGIAAGRSSCPDAVTTSTVQRPTGVGRETRSCARTSGTPRAGPPGPASQRDPLTISPLRRHTCSTGCRSPAGA